MKNFTQQTKQQLLQWWNHEKQDKPVILGTVYDQPLAPISDMEEYWRENSIRYKMFKDRLGGAQFYGAAIPHHYVDFGASAMAGALGCVMNPLTFDTIWPSHKFDELPAVSEIKIDEAGKWYQNLYSMVKQSAEDAEVSTTFYALGGINDTLGSLYGEQNLLMDMIDQPDEVHDCLKRICDIWIAEKDKMWNIIRTRQEGMASWAGIWAPGSTFPIQDDISFMLSTDMFDEFCLPYIKRCVESLEFPMYHLDGPQAIKHVDSLLKIDKLRAIQWIAGAGNEAILQWTPLMKKILNAGKSLQVYCNVEEVEPLLREIGTTGVLITLWNPTKDNMKTLEKYL